MEDIVERLRAITGQAGDYGDVQLCDAAADEIERLRGYRDEAEAEASIASLAAQRLRLTDAEREAVRFAISDSVDWPLDGPQLAVVASTLGPSCQVPEHRMKAALRRLLERMTP